MVVILLVYINFFFNTSFFCSLQNFYIKLHSKKGSLVTRRTRHLVLKYIILSLFTPYYNWKEGLCAVTWCNTGIQKKKEQKFDLQIQSTINEQLCEILCPSSLYYFISQIVSRISFKKIGA